MNMDVDNNNQDQEEMEKEPNTDCVEESVVETDSESEIGSIKESKSGTCSDTEESSESEAESSDKSEEKKKKSVVKVRRYRATSFPWEIPVIEEKPKVETFMEFKRKFAGFEDSVLRLFFDLRCDIDLAPPSDLQSSWEDYVRFVSCKMPDCVQTIRDIHIGKHVEDYHAESVEEYATNYCIDRGEGNNESHAIMPNSEWEKIVKAFPIKSSHVPKEMYNQNLGKSYTESVSNNFQEDVQKRKIPPLNTKPLHTSKSFSDCSARKPCNLCNIELVCPVPDLCTTSQNCIHVSPTFNVLNQDILDVFFRIPGKSLKDNRMSEDNGSTDLDSDEETCQRMQMPVFITDQDKLQNEGNLFIAAAQQYCKNTVYSPLSEKETEQVLNSAQGDVQKWNISNPADTNSMQPNYIQKTRTLETDGKFEDNQIEQSSMFNLPSFCNQEELQNQIISPSPAAFTQQPNFYQKEGQYQHTSQSPLNKYCTCNECVTQKAKETNAIQEIKILLDSNKEIVSVADCVEKKDVQTAAADLHINNNDIAANSPQITESQDNIFSEVSSASECEDCQIEWTSGMSESLQPCQHIFKKEATEEIAKMILDCSRFFTEKNKNWENFDLNLLLNSQVILENPFLQKFLVECLYAENFDFENQRIRNFLIKNEDILHEDVREKLDQAVDFNKDIFSQDSEKFQSTSAEISQLLNMKEFSENDLAVCNSKESSGKYIETLASESEGSKSEDNSLGSEGSQTSKMQICESRTVESVANNKLVNESPIIRNTENNDKFNEAIESPQIEGVNNDKIYEAIENKDNKNIVDDSPVAKTRENPLAKYLVDLSDDEDDVVPKGTEHSNDKDFDPGCSCLGCINKNLRTENPILPIEFAGLDEIEDSTSTLEKIIPEGQNTESRKRRKIPDLFCSDSEEEEEEEKEEEAGTPHRKYNLFQLIHSVAEKKKEKEIPKMRYNLRTRKPPEKKPRRF